MITNPAFGQGQFFIKDIWYNLNINKINFMILGKKEKVAVYIDGNNFYKYLKDEKINFPKGVKFDFNKFIIR